MLVEWPIISVVMVSVVPISSAPPLDHQRPGPAAVAPATPESVETALPSLPDPIPAHDPDDLQISFTMAWLFSLLRVEYLMVVLSCYA